MSFPHMKERWIIHVLRVEVINNESTNFVIENRVNVGELWQEEEVLTGS